MAHVVVEIEALIVDPHRLVLDRDVRKAVAIARDLVQVRADVCLDAVDIHRTVRLHQRAAVEHRHAPDVHRRVGRFEEQERNVLP